MALYYSWRLVIAPSTIAFLAGWWEYSELGLVNGLSLISTHLAKVNGPWPGKFKA